MNIILFPGSFSPFTDGHYGLVSRYLNTAKRQGINIDRVKILMSMKEREGVNPIVVYQFVSQVYSNDNRIEVVACDQSPIREVYEEVKDSNNSSNMYILARSDKDNDKVTEDFYKNFSKGGKYWYSGIQVRDLDVSREPIVYKNRKDSHNNEPISGTVAREDLKNHDFNSFLTSYSTIMSQEPITEKHIKRLFELLSR